MSALTRIEISRDYNDDGVRAWLVTPFYRLPGGRTVSVPDPRGWPTLGEAKREALRIAGADGPPRASGTAPW